MSTKTKTLADSGELEFIRHIRRMMPGDGGMFIRSAGDDCLVAESFAEDHILATMDTFVDGVHFTREYFTFDYIGRRCMAASVSDIAAMSGIPAYSLASLSMPQEILFDDAVLLFHGLQKTAEYYGCPIAGGETTSTSGPVTVTVTVIGKVEDNRAVTRSGAYEGDGIYVTGTIGDAMAGLMAYKHNEKGFDTLKSKFVAPQALVSLSRALTASYDITAMIDISDGLSTDLGHICEESCCGAEIYASSLPLSIEFLEFAKKHTLDSIDFALSSGEEFELLFTSNDRNIKDNFILDGINISRIGTVTKREQGMRLFKCENKVIPLIPKGYEHFK